jgi:hypothetical protein
MLGEGSGGPNVTGGLLCGAKSTGPSGKFALKK